MRKQKITGLAAVMIALATGFFSCTPESCFEETIAKIKAPFYLSSTQKIKAPDNLTVSGLNTDAGPVYENSKSVTRAELPLNPQAAMSSFAVIINGISDTLMLQYSSFPHLVSKECGYTFYFKLESVAHTNNNIDSVLIWNPSVTTGDEDNLRIFY